MARWPMGMLALALGAAGCKASLVCGPDTRDQNGQCVPAALSKCGAGTKLVGESCVPTSTLSCGTGTVEKDGQCTAETITCGPGTEDDGGVCNTVDPMKRVTVPEGPEPNIPPGKSTRFTLPAIGAPAVVLGGTIDPPTAGAGGVAVPDFDGFIFSGKKLERLHFQGLAVGAPTIGIALEPCTSTGTDVCTLDQTGSFVRLALTIDSRRPSRDVVLPSDGDWLVLVADQDAFTQQGLPYGGSGFTYTVDVTQLPLGSPAPLTPGTAATGQTESLTPLALQVTAAAPLYDVTLAPPDPTAPFPGQRALWGLSADGTLALNATDDTTYGTLTAMNPQRVAFSPGRALLFADDVYALGPTPPYTLTVTSVHTVAMGDLSQQPFSYRSDLADGGVDVYSVDVPANALLDVTMETPSGSQIDPLIEIRDQHYRVVASGRAFHLARFFSAGEAGHYYVVANDRTYNAGKVQEEYTLKAALLPVTLVGPLNVGDQAALQATSPDAGASWFAVYAGNDEDLGATVHPEASVDATLSMFPQTAVDPLETSDTGGAGADETVAPRLTGSGSLLLFEVAAAAGGGFQFTASARKTEAVFETEPNDTPQTATSLPLDQNLHAVAAGTLDSITDVDDYAFTLSTSLTITATVYPGLRGGTPQVLVGITNSGGGYYALADSGNGTYLATASVALPPGTYYAEVRYDWSVATASGPADYVLTVDGR